MRMDENVSPEWMQQCQGSKSGRRALQEIERLTALVKVLESDDHEWYLQADRVEKLEAENEHLADVVEVHIGGIDVLQKRIEKLEAENEMLRKIAAHIPVGDYISAKERAGFGVRIYPQAIAEVSDES